jgi:hypothetical protein
VRDHEANVQRSTRLRKASASDSLRRDKTAWLTFNVQHRNKKTWAGAALADELFFLLDKADVAAALDVADAYILKFFSSCIETKIFFDVVFGNVIAAHRAGNQLSILDN